MAIAAAPGFTARVFRRLREDPMGTVGLVLVLIVVFCGTAGPWITPFDPLKINVPDKFMAPSFSHFMGTDNLGRDVFSRIIAGSRIALTIGVSTIATALVIGLTLGLLAGYGPRWLDNLLMLLFDSIYSFPTVILGLTVVTLLGASITTLMLVVIVIQTPAYARLTRTATLTIKNSEYIQAIESLGASRFRIIFVHWPEWRWCSPARSPRFVRRVPKRSNTGTSTTAIASTRTERRESFPVAALV